MNSTFDKLDIESLKSRGISQAEAERQLSAFKTGFPYLEVLEPATAKHGIMVLDEEERKKALETYSACDRRVMKFVPASGAASRMFKDLFAASDALKNGQNIEGTPGRKFLDNIRKFAFYNPKLYGGLDSLGMLDATLSERGLNYGSKPKGEVLFHRYGDLSRTAFEEHLVEGALYASGKGIVRIAFSVSPEHMESFRRLFELVRTAYESRFGIRYEVSFTVQSPSTDTIAVDENNRPFRKEDGSLLFRPGGHGSLIRNLGALDTDVVIVKNIDNVVRESLVDDTVLWKKILAGVLLQLADRSFGYIHRLDACLDPKECHEDTVALCRDITGFLESEFCVTVPNVSPDIMPLYLKEKLNRPIRVCGMVRNEGEPGGGPFIVRDADGATSLQILESVQLDKSDPGTAALLSAATHFNPVDIACLITDYKGNKFNLERYVDEQAGFISYKSYGGRALKALERPGLWNGAMSNWNTAFVETPLATFNPVKTVLDLLRPEHCSE
ncbi:MAG: DUF4301 family protein [Bacteroidales bacterium]|jgi:hypothetical protein|nr:DUF4301 family protein [Bacteroidales bacterium]MCI2121613.1 DUF4301 family protein [Bacteroidales bacterium]MCI2144708.1 DUF4301 family protein [Bacteroidales bacterium]